MNINTTKKEVFGVLGLPRMGTTLVNNMLNSYNNCFCISEPHWANILRPNSVRLDKVNFDTRNNNEIYTNLKKYLEESTEFQLGGIKETYREHQKKSANYILNSPHVDFIIAVIRKPDVGFDAWLRSNWRGYYISPQNYVKSYKSLCRDLENCNKEIYWVQYEKVCNEGIEYLNKVFNGRLILEEINNIKKTNYIFGDEKANVGGNIKPPKTGTEKVPPHAISLINEKLNIFYHKHDI